MDFLSNPTAGFVSKRTTPVAGERPTPHAASSDGTETNYLSATNPASLRILSTDTFIFGGWLEKTTGFTGGTIFGKGPGGNISYTLDYGINAPSKFSIDVQKDDLNNSTTVTNNTAVADDTKTFVLCWIDLLTAKIAINAGTAASATHLPLQTADGGGDLKFFAAASNGFLGIIDNWFFCKNPPDLAAAITLINSTVYNGGTGINYSALSEANKTALGLVSWWAMDEGSTESRGDSHGANNLTVNGTITQATALVA